MVDAERQDLPEQTRIEREIITQSPHLADELKAMEAEKRDQENGDAIASLEETDASDGKEGVETTQSAEDTILAQDEDFSSEDFRPMRYEKRHSKGSNFALADDALPKRHREHPRRKGANLRDFLQTDFHATNETEERLTLQEYLQRNTFEGKELDETTRTLFYQTKEPLDRLRILIQLRITDALQLVQQEGGIKEKFLTARIQSYEDLLAGKKKNEHDEIIQPWTLQSPAIATGVLREVLYAEMLGTPQLAAYRLAERQARTNPNHAKTLVPLTRLFPMRGPHSGIEYGRTSIDFYERLTTIYQQAQNEIQHKKDPGNPQAIEHKTVLLTADWFLKAMEYPNPKKSVIPSNPYGCTIEEAIAWARLGPDVQPQLRGMKQKIDGANLRNIGRFIGVSGDGGGAGKEKRRASKDAARIPYDPSERQVFTQQRNTEDVANETRTYERKVAMLHAREMRREAQIRAQQFPPGEDEERLQLEHMHDAMRQARLNLETHHQEQVTRLQSRTPWQLEQALQQKAKAAEQRYQRRKSLAAKALVLESRFRPRERNEEVVALGAVDWINDAPFGILNRAYNAVLHGIDDQTIVALAATEMMTGDLLTKDVQKVTDLMHDQSDRYQLRKAVHDGMILSRYSNRMQQAENAEEAKKARLSIDAIVDISRKDTRGLEQALETFGFETVQDFLSKRTLLVEAVRCKKAADALGLTLTTEEIARVSFFGDMDFGKVLGEFNEEAIKTLLQRGVSLEEAASVQRILKIYANRLPEAEQAPYQLSLDNLSDLALLAHEAVGHSKIEQDLSAALTHLPLSQIQELYGNRVNYTAFSEIQYALEDHEYELDFSEMIALAKKTRPELLQLALDNFSLEEVRELIKNDTPLDLAQALAETLQQNGMAITDVTILGKFISMGETVISVSEASQSFSYEEIVDLVESKAPLYSAVQVKAKLIEMGKAQLAHLPIIRATVLGHKPEVMRRFNASIAIEPLIQTIDAGFSEEEISQYPFLISSSVTELK